MAHRVQALHRTRCGSGCAPRTRENSLRLCQGASVRISRNFFLETVARGWKGRFGVQVPESSVVMRNRTHTHRLYWNICSYKLKAVSNLSHCLELLC